MRLTINLRDDHYALAKGIARETQKSVSKAVEGLIDRGLQVVPLKAGKKHYTVGKNGLPVVQGTRPFTSEDVYRIDLETS
jgi:hypothetical protein